MITRTHTRPKRIRIRVFLEDPTIKTRFARWGGEMYRYRHNKRLRAAFLTDFRLGRVRGHG